MTSLTRYATCATASLASMILNLRFMMLPCADSCRVHECALSGRGTLGPTCTKAYGEWRTASAMWVTAGCDNHHRAVARACNFRAQGNRREALRVVPAVSG